MSHFPAHLVPGALGKAPGRGLVDQFYDHSVTFLKPLCDCIGECVLVGAVIADGPKISSKQYEGLVPYRGSASLL